MQMERAAQLESAWKACGNPPCDTQFMKKNITRLCHRLRLHNLWGTFRSGAFRI